MRTSQVVVSLFLLCALSACGHHPCKQVVAAPALMDVAPKLSVAESRLESELILDVTSPLEAARASVPALYRTSDNHGTTWNGGNSNQGWLYVDSHGRSVHAGKSSYRVRAEVVRDWANYTLTTGGVVYNAQLRYRLHGQGRVGPFWVGGFCGTNNQAVLSLTVAGKTDFVVTSDWHLASRSSLTVKVMDPCVITVGPFTSPPILAQQLRNAIDQVVLAPIAARIDQSVAAIDLAGGVARLWRTLQQPINAQNLSFALHPTGLSLGALVGSGTSAISPPRATIHVAVGVRAFPTVSSLAQPPDNGALPAIVKPSGGGVFVETAIELSYQQLNQALARLLERPLSVAGGSVRILRATARHAGSGQLAVDVAFKGKGAGSFCGTATLVGKPVVDVLGQSVSFPTLDFTQTSDSRLLNAYVWLEKAALREQLRLASRLDFGASLAEMETRLRAHAAASQIDLTVDQRRVLGVQLDSSVRVIMEMGGAIKLPPIVVP
jgi:Domain of unknown function (DUF4403)